MALSKKQKKELDIMMADKKASNDLEQAMANNTAPSARTGKILAIALGSKKLAKELLADIVAPAQISKPAENALDIAAASEKEGNAIEAEIES